jgi:carbonic anhydrase/acetyltransferase-like protein (isoleucine patch superfamily)
MGIKQTLLSTPRKLRLKAFIARTKAMAKLQGIDLTLDIHPTVTLPKDIKFEFTPGKPVTVRIGEHTTIEEGFHVKFFAHCGQEPQLLIGPRVMFHRDVTMVLQGKACFAGFNEIGVGNVIRVSQGFEFGMMSGTGEYVSFYDFHHATNEEQSVIFQRVLVSNPIKIGNWVVIGPKATINPGSIISDMSLVFPMSVVAGQFLEPGRFLNGIPATEFLRPEIWPVLENPLVKMMVTWQEGKPGPNYKTADEALAAMPAPAHYDKDKHGYEAQLRRVQELKAKREAEKAAKAEAETAEATEATNTPDGSVPAG